MILQVDVISNIVSPICNDFVSIPKVDDTSNGMISYTNQLVVWIPGTERNGAFLHRSGGWTSGVGVFFWYGRWNDETTKEPMKTTNETEITKQTIIHDN